MSIGAILIGLAMLIGVIPYVLSPLLGKKNAGKTIFIEDEDVSVEIQHQNTLLALRDLEFDHQVGKVSDEDYDGLRATLLIQAAASLEAEEKKDTDLDARLEEAIRLRREKQSNGQVCAHCGKPLVATDRFCRACGKPVQATCPKCGEKLQINDVFCGSCGAQLTSIKMILPAEGS